MRRRSSGTLGIGTLGASEMLEVSQQLTYWWFWDDPKGLDDWVLLRFGLMR